MGHDVVDENGNVWFTWEPYDEAAEERFRRELYMKTPTPPAPALPDGLTPDTSEPRVFRVGADEELSPDFTGDGLREGWKKFDNGPVQ